MSNVRPHILVVRWLQKLKTTFGQMTRIGRLRTFVSHSYADSAHLNELRVVAGSKHCLVVFPPIDVPPSKMVSTEFLATLRTCDALIFVDADASRASPWVCLEIETAKRLGLLVLRFDVGIKKLERDGRPPIRLPVFASWTRKDDPLVRPLVDFMVKERAFDMPDDEKYPLGANFAALHEEGLKSRLDAGGFVLAFITRNSLQSRYVIAEIEYAFHHHPNQMLPVLLDDLNVDELNRLNIQEYQVAKLGLSNGRIADMRQFDNLVVLLYLRIHQNAGLESPSAPRRPRHSASIRE